MATVTASYNWVSGETVTPTKLNSTAAPTVVVADNEITTAKILDGNVTLAKLATAVQESLLPAGAVQAFAMNSAPAGWLAADGSNVNRTTYAALFSAIGTTYGAGDGSTTFALPDLRGIFVRGSGSQAISGTTYSGTFANKQNDQIGSHTHALQNVRVVSQGETAGSSLQILDAETGVNNQVVTTSVGGTQGDTEVRPANIAMLYCIKF